MEAQAGVEWSISAHELAAGFGATAQRAWAAIVTLHSKLTSGKKN